MRQFIAIFFRSQKARIIVMAAVLALAVAASVFVTPYTSSGTKTMFVGEVGGPDSVSMRAKVIEVTSTGTLRVEILDGLRDGSVRVVNEPVERHESKVGDIVVINESEQVGIVAYGPWRLPGMILLGALLIVIVIAVSGLKGLYSLAGLVFGVCIIFLYTVPSILAGNNALIACIVSAFIIGTISVSVAHGLSKRAFVSSIAIGIILIVAVVLAVLGSLLAKLSGSVDESSWFITTHYSHIDIAGVLVGGMVIATLGVLDDVVTTQVATADEIMKADRRLGTWDIFRRTMSVGNEHISALINTLVLAYVGVSLPTILTLLLTTSAYSSLTLISSEFIAHEIVRALISSIALVLAVPISTIVAVVLLKVKPHSLWAELRRQPTGSRDR